MKYVLILALAASTTIVAGSGYSSAFGQDVGQLKEAKDVPGLVRLLRHRDGKIRSSAAVALSGVIREVDDSKTLARYVLPLIDVTLRDPYATVREYAGRALQHCLQNVTDVSILRGRRAADGRFALCERSRRKASALLRRAALKGYPADQA